jgi:hypothetical protein
MIKLFFQNILEYLLFSNNNTINKRALTSTYFQNTYTDSIKIIIKVMFIY